MVFKGMKFRYATDLLYRLSNGKDEYINGGVIKPHHVVVVKIKDCAKLDISPNDHNLRYNTDDAKAISDIRSHGLTNMIYGAWRRRASTKGTIVENIDTKRIEISHDYFQCNVYLVKDGSVYKSSIKRANTNSQFKIVMNGK